MNWFRSLANFRFRKAFLLVHFRFGQGPFFVFVISKVQFFLSVFSLRYLTVCLFVQSKILFIFNFLKSANDIDVFFKLNLNWFERLSLNLKYYAMSSLQLNYIWCFLSPVHQLDALWIWLSSNIRLTVAKAYNQLLQRFSKMALPHILKWCSSINYIAPWKMEQYNQI